MKLQDQLLASKLVVYALLHEFANIDNIYESYKPIIKSAVQLLKTDLENPESKRSLLPFLGDASKRLADTATTRDTCKIKQYVNQLIQVQSKYQETSPCNFYLNVTTYATK